MQCLTIISAGGHDKVGLEVVDVDVDLDRTMHRPPRLAEVNDGHRQLSTAQPIAYRAVSRFE